MKNGVEDENGVRSLNYTNDSMKPRQIAEMKECENLQVEVHFKNICQHEGCASRLENDVNSSEATLSDMCEDCK